MTLEPFHYNWLNGTPTTSFDSNNTQPALNSIVDGLFMPFAGYPERSAHPSNFSFAEVAAVPFEALPSTEPPAPTGQFPADVLFFDTIGRKRVRYTLRDNTGDKLVGPTHEFDVHDIDHVDPTSLCNDESFFQEYKYYSNPYLDEDGNPRKRWPFEVSVAGEARRLPSCATWSKKDTDFLRFFASLPAFAKQRSVNNLLWNMILYNEELRGFGRRDLGRIVDTYRDLSGLTKRSQHKPPKDVRAHPYSNTKTKTRQARRTEASVGDFESFMSPTVSPLPHGRFTRR